MVCFRTLRRHSLGPTEAKQLSTDATRRAKTLCKLCCCGSRWRLPQACVPEQWCDGARSRQPANTTDTSEKCALLDQAVRCSKGCSEGRSEGQLGSMKTYASSGHLLLGLRRQASVHYASQESWHFRELNLFSGWSVPLCSLDESSLRFKGCLICCRERAFAIRSRLCESPYL